MKDLVQDPYFEKQIGQRLSFTGIYDGFKVNYSNPKPGKKFYKYSVIFIRVREKGTEREFRDHVHIQIEEKKFKEIFADLERGYHLFSFSAEVYRYLGPLKSHKDGLLYKEHRIGLKKISKLNYLTKEKEFVSNLIGGNQYDKPKTK